MLYNNCENQILLKKRNRNAALNLTPGWQKSAWVLVMNYYKFVIHTYTYDLSKLLYGN